MIYQTFRILFRLFFVFAILDSVTPNAVFEIDLLRYEAQPHKCCDGYKWVKIGPARCTECDPYFRICMSHIPGGPSKCTTTTRENNVHSTDLTRGNIQPNHLSLDLNSLQGSLLVDIDIKDYDSTTKDDDIDHLYYTFKSVPSPEKVTVILNGTRVRLTITLLVKCQANYYGSDCNTYCVNGTSWFCSSEGEKVCKQGFAGANCDVKLTTIPSFPSSKTTEITSLNAKTQSRTENPTSSSQQKFDDSQTIHSHTTNNDVLVTLTPSVEEFPTISQTTKVENVDPATDGEQQDIKRLTTDTGLRYISENTTEKGTQDTGTQTSSLLPTISPRATKQSKFSIPEPIEIYSCNVAIEGHRVGLHQPVEEIITTVLSNNVTDSQIIKVHVTSSTFETTDNGVDVTDVSFIVIYDGAVLPAIKVSSWLFSPPKSDLLTQHLHAKNLKQHSNQITSTDSPTTDGMKEWVTNHLPFVIVVSSVIGICIVVFAVFIGKCIFRKRTSSAEKTKTRFPKSVRYNEDQTLQMFSNKLSFDTPFALENPLYDFSCDQLQPSDASHV